MAGIAAEVRAERASGRSTRLRRTGTTASRQ
jgi:hypothetical protein